MILKALRFHFYLKDIEKAIPLKFGENRERIETEKAGFTGFFCVCEYIIRKKRA